MKQAKIRNCPKCGSIPSCYREIGVIYTTWWLKINRSKPFARLWYFGKVNKTVTGGALIELIDGSNDK